MWALTDLHSTNRACRGHCVYGRARILQRASENREDLVCEKRFLERPEGRCTIADHKAHAVGPISAGKFALHVPALCQRATLAGKRSVALQSSAAQFKSWQSPTLKHNLYRGCLGSGFHLVKSRGRVAMNKEVTYLCCLAICAERAGPKQHIQHGIG